MSKCKRRHNMRELSPLIKCSKNHWPRDREVLAECMARYATSNSKCNVNVRPRLLISELPGDKYVVVMPNIRKVMDLPEGATKADIDQAMVNFLNLYLQHVPLIVIHWDEVNEDGQVIPLQQGSATSASDVDISPPLSPLPVADQDTYLPRAIGNMMQCSTCLSGVEEWLGDEDTNQTRWTRTPKRGAKSNFRPACKTPKKKK